MKEKTKKRFALSALVLSAMLVLPTGAFAWKSDSTSGKVGDLTTYGSTTISSDSASAYTSASDQAFQKVSLTYEYGWGDISDVYYAYGSDNGYKTSVSANAKATKRNPTSLKAYSSHFVASGQASWSDNTSVSY
ncbi:hypothetical protein M5X00_06135 [Paenibacillus alvei]|uniref:Uncharacterized protein n=2 Tax=Paenibacillus alvei TaxID=44250 RepID=A0ABT4GXL2_PAEAL|nr:hypothetical protein [Paenibacillus alvei]EJW20209.1 hypothetical protein PAV_1c12080 [Paenibacillus alvei DSM 29]MCY9539580.1 hypothetical protein [Paenibacillus alvei]MCY9704028.1 hypothetical protein [Paenibacillus alvei]MCY9734025.1 hypothetical protein [Paenibacillus alvei]MCY9753835.1 hypothetical protein [Paenibacillus alvei]